MKKKEGYLKIIDVEKQTGIPRSTIHFYLKQGLLHPPVKTGQTMAYYDESHVERLKLIQQMKTGQGIPTRFIKERLAKQDSGSKPESMSKDRSSKALGYSLIGDLKDRRKNEIINAGVKLFSKKGFYKTKIKDITDDLDLSIGTFYIYFKNKDELFLEAINDVVKTILGGAATAIKNEKDPIMRMLLRGQVFFEQYSKYSEILNQLRAEMTRDSKWFQDKVKKIYHDLTLPVIKELNEAMELGIIRKADSDLMAYAMTGIIESLCFRMSVDKAYTIDKIFKFLIDMLVNGLPLTMKSMQVEMFQSYLERLKSTDKKIDKE
ncbi:MAG: MerR family transcriptional regulator [Proteobacteria bacterium]|nr:MerR family transcriptional regulator [Pseudomonadota bacterium]